jgi:hypothetical protein
MFHLKFKKQNSMKKIIVCCALALSSIFLTVSCQKTKMNPNQTDGSNIQSFDFRTDSKFNELFVAEKAEHNSNLRIDNTKIIEIANIQDEEVRKLAIATLDNDEKVDFWNYVVEYHINNDNYTPLQRALVNSLKEVTVNKPFFQNQYLRTVFNNYFAPYIRIQLNNAGISNARMSAAFADGRLIYTEPEAQKPGPGGQKLKCDCSPSTLFTMCNTCKATDNCTQSTNCGFLFGSNCDGLCPKYLPTNYPLN